MVKTPGPRRQITYVAFLRGINVGGHSVIKMAGLRGIFESLGYRSVKTVMASGNVLFEAPADDATTLSRRLSGELKGLLKREITAVVWPVEDLRALEASEPFKGIDGKTGARPIVTFVAADVKDRDIPALSACHGFQVLSISDGIVCSVSYDQYGVSTAESMGYIEKAFGHKVTTRTWDTIKKVLIASDKA